jgi:hypothetical protein
MVDYYTDRISGVSEYEETISRYEKETLPKQIREELLYRRSELKRLRDTLLISDRKFRRIQQKERLGRKKLSLEVQRRLEMADDRARADRLELERKLLKTNNKHLTPKTT